jgi:hypothetical protein
LGLGLGAGSLTSFGQAATAVAAGDAAKDVAKTFEKIVENITEFFSDPKVLGATVGIVVLVVLGPTLAAARR